MSHYLHPSHPNATRKDVIHWRRRQERLNPTVVQNFKDFWINTMFKLRRFVRWPFLDSKSSETK